MGSLQLEMGFELVPRLHTRAKMQAQLQISMRIRMHTSTPLAACRVVFSSSSDAMRVSAASRSTCCCLE